ncbi:nicotinamide N-methyltransferase-like isoform X2 [Microcaecilia unicolor]|uniref:Nicotinamide N-methyltransferase-like isoform X2 n=1 Tax=Microcaecilia unicolor TaxID=1415580 RepID=A0A6P7ZFX7_9AMPH|nr:nicotinamide N-methyltransferase-like isoform X2 [Microcaecilia unicolor]
MASDFTDKETYQKDFDPKAYLDTYYASENGHRITDEYLIFMLKNLFNTFTSGVKGNLLLDIGTGPSIYHLLSACESFNEIIATDYTDRNRQELETWLKKEPGAFDWSSVVKFVCELEGDREKWAEKEEKLRRTVTRILKCDVTKNNSLDPLVLPQADCLLTCLCLEGASKDPDSYCCALRNISSLLKSGGHLVMGGVLGNGMYMVGEKQFSGFPMDKEFLEKAVSGEGYVVEQLEVQPRSDLTGVHLANYNAIFFVLARKMGDKQSS